MKDWHNTVRKWFAEHWEQCISVTASREEDFRKGRLFNILMFISMGISITIALCLISLTLKELTLLWKLWLIAFPVLSILFSVFCWVRARMGHIRSMISLYFWTNFLLISLAIFFVDGTHSCGWILYMWTISIAGILIKPIYALWMTTSTLVYFFLLLLLFHTGFYRPLLDLGMHGSQGFLPIAFQFIMMFSTVGFLTFLNMKSLHNTLTKLRSTTKALEEQQFLLETKVIERTNALNEANEKLTTWTEELVKRNQQNELLNNMGEFMQSCQLIEEAYSILAQTMKQLFPDDSGAFFAFRNSRNLLENAAVWGKATPQEMTFAPEDCWAIRRGRYHGVSDTNTEMKCKHIGEGIKTYMCMPVISQGEVLGLFYLLKNNSNETCRAVTWLEDNRRIVQRITEQIGLLLGNIKLRETLKTLSIRDPLTGLFNRRFMEESFEREFSLAIRKNHSIGVILLDIDHFKRLNDTFGHEAGDTALVELGALLRKCVRPSDIACRYGGEEFLLILPDSSLAVTLERAEHIREQVKHIHLTYAKQTLGSISISAGVAVFPHHGETGATVLHAADTALYQAKKTGRDRVCIAGIEGDAAA